MSIGFAGSIILFLLALVLLRPSWSFICGKESHDPPVLDNLGLLETVRVMEGTSFHQQLVSSDLVDKKGLREAAVNVKVKLVGDRLLHVGSKRDSGASEASSSSMMGEDVKALAGKSR